jgi:hypothetical protein
MKTRRRLSVVTVCVALSFAQCLAQGPESKVGGKIHLTGEKARGLISILDSGGVVNPEVEKVFPMPHTAGVIALRDLNVLRASTYKYDADISIYKLNLYSATAKIGSSDNPVKVGEAIALWNYFTDLRLKTDLGLEGTYFMITTINCKIDANLDITSPTRFQCDLVIPGWAMPHGKPGR